MGVGGQKSLPQNLNISSAHTFETVYPVTTTPPVSGGWPKEAEVGNCGFWLPRKDSKSTSQPMRAHSSLGSPCTNSLTNASAGLGVSHGPFQMTTNSSPASPRHASSLRAEVTWLFLPKKLFLKQNHVLL